MHWSKSRHRDYLDCPRRFFYANVAAPQNREIRKLAEKRTAPLIRHELVRDTIREILQTSNDWSSDRRDAMLQTVEDGLAQLIGERITVSEQMSVIRLCIENFFEYHLPEIAKHSIVHISPGEPIEFVYDRMSIMAVPELVLDEGSQVRIVNWRTGSSGYRVHDDFRLRAGGLTCWSRSVLKCVDRPTAISEVYLREPDGIYEEVLTDAEIRRFIDTAREVTAQYSNSAKIRDFPAQPSLSNCRFCSFKSICPEWQEFSESSYEIDALGQEIASGREARIRERAKEQALKEVGGEVRRVFLSHVSEDKHEYVRPFARALEARGITYWLDEAELAWGDGLTKGINKGLAISEHVICFISGAFIDRGWPEAELGAAMASQLAGEGTKVLPILIAESSAVFGEYPLLRDRICKSWEDGIESLVNELAHVLDSQ